MNWGMKMMNDITGHDQSLEDMFGVARAQSTVPSDAFMARLLADADALQPKANTEPSLAAPRRGMWSRLIATLGGAVVIAGIGSAAMAGLVIGYVQPEPILLLTDDLGLTVPADVDLLPNFDLFLTEEPVQ